MHKYILKIILLSCILNTYIQHSYATDANINMRKIEIDEDLMFKLSAVLSKKQREFINNSKFYHAARDAEHDNMRAKWQEFGACADIEMERVVLAPKKILKIGNVDLEVFDISELDYIFHIHTTSINRDKAEYLKEYILNKDNYNRIINNQLNFDICPLISTSIIDKFTNGYTENLCNLGKELQIHLILKVNPYAVAWMEPKDAYAPAKNAISKYLNNQQGRETLVEVLSSNLNTLCSPEDILQKTHINSESKFKSNSGFNEVVIAGNNYGCFFPGAKNIEVIGIGLSSYWLERKKEAEEDDIIALKELGEQIPLFYYEPAIENLLALNILLGYRPDKQTWISRLKNDFSKKTYCSVIESNEKILLFGVPFSGLFYLSLERHSQFAPAFENFITLYNNFIKVLYSLESNLDTIYKALKDTICANLQLAIEVQFPENKHYQRLLNALTARD
jgi:hypothetical protein